MRQNCRQCQNRMAADAELCWVCDAAAKNEGFKQCGECARSIRKEAVICRFCTTKSDRLSVWFVVELEKYVESRIGASNAVSKEYAGCLQRLLLLEEAEDYAVLSEPEATALITTLCQIGKEFIRRVFVYWANKRGTAFGDRNRLDAYLVTLCREVLRLTGAAPISIDGVRAVSEFVKFFMARPDGRDRKFPEAKLLCDEMLRLAEVLRASSTDVAEFLSTCAAIHALEDDLAGSFDYFMQALDAVQKDESRDSWQLCFQLGAAVTAGARAEKHDQVIQLCKRKIAVMQEAREPYFGKPQANAVINWKYEWARVYMELGRAQQAGEQFFNAIASYEKSLAIYEKDIGTLGAGSELFLFIGQCYARINDHSKAEEVLHSAVRFNSGIGQAKARLALAKIYRKQERIAELDSTVTLIEELYFQEKRRRQECNNVEIGQLLDDCARLTADTIFRARAIQCLQFSLGIYKNALMTWSSKSYRKELKKYLFRTWQAVESDLLLLADMLEQDLIGGDIAQMRSQAAFIREQEFSPGALSDFANQLCTGEK